MNVREWMSPDPITIAPSATAGEAWRLLVDQGVRHLPVVEDDVLVGIVSDRDVRAADVAERSVEGVMSVPVHVVDPEEPIESAARTMLSRRISALPVVDPELGLVGIITTTDCLLASLVPEAVR